MTALHELESCRSLAYLKVVTLSEGNIMTLLQEIDPSGQVFCLPEVVLDVWPKLYG
jgi:hypothetical protein